MAGNIGCGYLPAFPVDVMADLAVDGTARFLPVEQAQPFFQIDIKEYLCQTTSGEVHDCCKLETKVISF